MKSFYRVFHGVPPAQTMPGTYPVGYNCDVGTTTCDPPQAPHFLSKLSPGAKQSDGMQRLRATWSLRGFVSQLKKDNWMCDARMRGYRIERAKQFLAQQKILAANGPQEQEMFATLAEWMAKSATRCPPLDKTVPATF